METMHLFINYIDYALQLPTKNKKKIISYFCLLHYNSKIFNFLFVLNDNCLIVESTVQGEPDSLYKW